MNKTNRNNTIEAGLYKAKEKGASLIAYCKNDNQLMVFGNKVFSYILLIDFQSNAGIDWINFLDDTGSYWVCTLDHIFNRKFEKVR